MQRLQTLICFSTQVAHQVGVPQLFHDLYIIELDIKELVNRFKNAFDRDIVLEFNGHFMVDEGLEEAKAHKLELGKREALDA